MFNILEAMTGSIKRLRHIQRYSSLPCIKPESVVEHSWMVAFLSYQIAWDIRSVKVDLGDLFSKAIMHDVSECMSGDIIRTYKYSTPEMREMCDKADHVNMQRLAVEFGSNGPIMEEDWSMSKDPSLEGQIVRFADLVAVVLYCVEEYHLGNRELESTLERVWRENLLDYQDHAYFGQYVWQLFPNGMYTDPLQLRQTLTPMQLRKTQPAPPPFVPVPIMDGISWADGVDGGPQMSSAAQAELKAREGVVPPGKPMGQCHE